MTVRWRVRTLMGLVVAVALGVKGVIPPETPRGRWLHPPYNAAARSIDSPGRTPLS